ncbi:LOW QUALITY PROTEIN: glutamine and serine-rich protein 1 [Cottoperca gobio]|uniref:LOW QUALITY PROTEIN: glutamine and serine-rich protein 1 n=1 Tax=Cottoperca gobio TaxID=56716 RepID=A0A6J2RXK4_COTGO|nr:LOW QUALITY PROTEIN: glutamine and serine-rich protein 1 [Cottoperca gobio]
MMDRNYPTSSFADALAPPAQTVASWAYDRSTASVKPSSSYGAAHLDAELLQRQSYASTHQLPTYTTSHLPVAAGALDSSSNTSETSIMSFLSAMESRSLQAGPVSASLLPPFRPPSWPAGTNSSTTELYLTGALPSTATFSSPAALSSYQHTGAYPSRSYATNPSLALQDPAFSTSTNGLFSHHDPLLHLKSGQTVLPTALAFNHLSSPTLGSTLPVQSSTYRSAQESAPHLLQPQFSLLPSALPAPHGASQAYGAAVFSGSIERALQRECSVIKHHQRPSSSHTASEQLPNSEHSLQGYFVSGTEADVSYQQDPSRQTPVSCSPSTGADSSQGVNRVPQPKTESVTQAYSSTSVPKAKDCSSKLAPHLAGGEESHEHSQNLTGGSPDRYSSTGQKQNSVIANQQSVQLSSLMSSSLAQTYITPHTQSQPSHSTSDKHSPLYKTLPSLSSQSDNVVSVGQTLIYSSSPGLSQEQEIHYGAQVQGLCQGNLSESYSTSHSQGAPNVTFTSLSQGQASVTQSYARGQSLNLNSSYPPTCVRSLPTTNSSQDDYTLMQSPVGVKMHDALSQQQTQPHKYVLSAPLPTYSLTAQALQNNIRSSIQDIKPIYGKQKLGELPIQDMDALQQSSMEASAAASNMSAHNNVIYVVSKMDDNHKTQSVIRSNSRSDDQLMGLGHTNAAQGKDERMGSLLHLSSANGQEIANTKTTNSSIISSHAPLSSEQLKQHPLQLKSPEPHQQNHQNLTRSQSQSPAAHTQYITVPSTQVLLEPNQMILLQQPLLHHSQNTSKVVSLQGIQQAQDLGPLHVQYLQMGRELLGPGVTETQRQQGTVVPEQSSGCSDSSKHHYSQSTNQQPNDAKNHFALNSICFPDSMLLADDRNILSNVDDILAATVAACGVTPQDFVKATSSAEAEMAVMASPVDSKGHFQTADIRHMSPSFSSAQQSIMTNSNSHNMTMTLNGARMATDCQSQPVHHNSSELDTNGDGGSSENDYHLAGQVYDPPGFQSRVKGNAKCIKTEDGLMESPGGEDFPKKKARSRSLTKPGGPEDDSGQARPAKRSGQAKRQNSRGSDVGSPSASHGVYDGCPQQERIRQKIREVEEKQPEVKTGFIGSFLDFIKSGPKQQYSPSPTRTISRPRKPCTLSKPPLCTLPSLPPKLQIMPGPLIHQESQGVISQQKRLDEDLQKNLETLPSFSSDEEENTGKNQALRNSISSALSALDESSDRKTRTDDHIPGPMMKPDQVPIMPHTIPQTILSRVTTPTHTTNTVSLGTVFVAKEESKETPPGQLAVQLTSVAIEGLTDEELSDSGGEGMYRERDEFVVRNEDIENLKVTMRAGSEPPAIWKVQKALLQKFVPELRDGKRVFSATNSYLGYFGDAKTMYQRVYVKFLDTVNKREYVRVCSRKPRCKPMNSLRGVQVKTLLGLTSAPSSVSQSQKPRPKQLKPRAEPPPKKRRKWKEEFSPTASGSSAEEGGEDDELNPPVPFASRLLNTRTMKETFRSFVELLISIALDEDVMTALERANDELLLPHMKRVDVMISDNRKRLLHKLHIEQVLKTALDSFPEISVVTELKKDRETPAFKVRLSGRAYNKKTLKPYKMPYKMPNKVPQEYTVDQQKTQWFSLYHSLQHYKYHTYLMCKDEIASMRVQTGDLGQEETVQKCLQNGAWVEGLFDRFGELISQVQQACR